VAEPVAETTASSAPAGGSSSAGQKAAPGTTGRPSKKFDRSIVEGNLSTAVARMAGPTIIANMLGGLQGVIDHALVGNFVGFTANAAIGVAWQIFLIVIVFISSLFSGMSVLVARFAGANDHEKVDRVVYQAFITAIGLSWFVLAPIGYVLSPWLLTLVNASPAVQAEALPFLRIMFVASSGMLIFFMLAGALRAAGDARTPMVLGMVMTVLNIILNIVFIRGLGPIPAMGTKGAAIGTSIASGLVGLYSLYKLLSGGWVVSFPKHHGFAPDWEIIRSIFRFGLPTGFQGIAMNIGGVLLLGYIGSVPFGAEAQASYAVGYTELFSFITWTSQALLGAAAAVAGQNLGAGQPERAVQAVHTAARYGLGWAAVIGVLFLTIPTQLLGLFGMNEPVVLEIGTGLLRVLALSGLFITVALTYTGGLQGTGDTKSPLYISIISQIIIPLGICFVVSAMTTLQPMHIWLAILAGHFTRCTLSVIRFNQGKWRDIKVEIASNR
jgi:putative MATE family efflux protein